MAPYGCTYYFIAPLVFCILTAFVFLDGAEDIRLVGGSLPNEGRIEVFVNDGWHTICSNQATWTMKNSEVVCRQLGYAGNVIEIFDAYFGEGNGQTINDPTDCSGGLTYYIIQDERHLKDCPQRQEIINCNHSEDMSIICRLPGYLGCYRHDLNLTDQVTRHVNTSLRVVTPFNCAEACWQISTSYAVVSATGCQCIESNVWGYGEVGDDSDTCAEPCPDNKFYVCGGFSNVDIYKTADVICPDPGIPLNGERHGNRFFFGDQVQFRCEEGYTLDGASTTQCTVGSNNTVEWDNAVPLCTFDLVSDSSTSVSSTEYPEASFRSVTIAEYLSSDKVPLTDFNDGTTNLMASSDVTILRGPASSTAKTLGYVISLTTPREFLLSKNNGAVTSVTENPTGIGATDIVTIENLSSMSTDQPIMIQSSIQSNPLTSKTMHKLPTDDRQRTMLSPTQPLTRHEDSEKELTTIGGKGTVSKATIPSMYYTSTEPLQTVSEELLTEASGLDGGTLCRLIVILVAAVILLTNLTMLIICCRWCRKKKPIFRVASAATQSDMRSSFVFSRGSDSYRKFGQQPPSENVKPDLVTMGTTFGHDDADTSNYYQNAMFMEPGYEQQRVDPSERDESHREAIKMFRESKIDMYNQFDFEVPTEDEITEEEELQCPSSFLEDDSVKQSTV